MGGTSRIDLWQDRKAFHAISTQLQEAAEYYRDAKDGAAKDKALKRLHDLASKYFEEDMEVAQERADGHRGPAGETALATRSSPCQEGRDRRPAGEGGDQRGRGTWFHERLRNDFKFDVRVAAPVITALDAPKAEVVADPLSSDLLGPPVRVEAPVPPSPPLPPVDGSQLLGYGAEGEAVRLLQITLNEKLDPSPELDVDGDFGPETDKALKAFQAENDLEETGVVDDATRKKLELPAELPPFIYN